VLDRLAAAYYDLTNWLKEKRGTTGRLYDRADSRRLARRQRALAQATHLPALIIDPRLVELTQVIRRHFNDAKAD
jgi:hypothetical protein